MFCPKCGNELKPGHLFCGQCGTKVPFNVQNPVEEPVVENTTSAIAVIDPPVTQDSYDAGTSAFTPEREVKSLKYTADPDKTKKENRKTFLFYAVLGALTLWIIVWYTGFGMIHLHGTYLEVDGAEKIEFRGNSVTITEGGLTMSGSYKLKGDKIHLNVALWLVDIDKDYYFKKEGNYITIDDTQYKKQWF